MKLNILLCILIVLVTGCVPVHMEGSASVSWGEHQRIDSNKSTKIAHVEEQEDQVIRVRPVLPPATGGGGSSSGGAVGR